MSEIIQESGVGEAPLSRYCRRCHRKLRSEKAMKTGYGPVCIKKMMQKGDDSNAPI
ncbi:DUF6011 domain-containing protein [Candidatus Pacearchaeota archaeon]|jgi:hypothetical protein|nr:DUF6011 domain-containing protein [Candidatus Pacearchaeota archaeon]